MIFSRFYFSYIALEQFYGTQLLLCLVEEGSSVVISSMVGEFLQSTESGTT